jgi:hypothetical protein
MTLEGRQKPPLKKKHEPINKKPGNNNQAGKPNSSI